MRAICISNNVEELSDPELDQYSPLIGCEYEIDGVDQDGWYFIQELQPIGNRLVFEPGNFKLLS